MKSIVLVPHLHKVEEPCEEGLKQLETAGIKVWRFRGCSAIDQARCRMVSYAMQDGFDSMLFIDADVSFDYKDALRLLERPEPVISGVYAIKGARRFASIFDDVKEVTFGVGAPDSYPLVYAATGFLKIQSSHLTKMIDYFKFPICDTKWGKGFWPFFMPMIVPQGTGHHYLSEDWAFSHRCREMGVSPLADTSIRLYHWDGKRCYGWEDAGGSEGRFATYRFKCNY